MSTNPSSSSSPWSSPSILWESATLGISLLSQISCLVVISLSLFRRELLLLPARIQFHPTALNVVWASINVCCVVCTLAGLQFDCYIAGPLDHAASVVALAWFAAIFLDLMRKLPLAITPGLPLPIRAHVMDERLYAGSTLLLGVLAIVLPILVQEGVVTLPLSSNLVSWSSSRRRSEDATSTDAGSNPLEAAEYSGGPFQAMPSTSAHAYERLGDGTCALSHGQVVLRIATQTGPAAVVLLYMIAVTVWAVRYVRAHAAPDRAPIVAQRILVRCLRFIAILCIAWVPAMAVDGMLLVAAIGAQQGGGTGTGSSTSFAAALDNAVPFVLLLFRSGCLALQGTLMAALWAIHSWKIIKELIPHRLVTCAATCSFLAASLARCTLRFIIGISCALFCCCFCCGTWRYDTGFGMGTGGGADGEGGLGSAVEDALGPTASTSLTGHRKEGRGGRRGGQGHGHGHPLLDQPGSSNYGGQATLEDATAGGNGGGGGGGEFDQEEDDDASILTGSQADAWEIAADAAAAIEMALPSRGGGGNGRRYYNAAALGGGGGGLPATAVRVPTSGNRMQPTLMTAVNSGPAMAAATRRISGYRVVSVKPSPDTLKKESSGDGVGNIYTEPYSTAAAAAAAAAAASGAPHSSVQAGKMAIAATPSTNKYANLEKATSSGFFSSLFRPFASSTTNSAGGARGAATSRHFSLNGATNANSSGDVDYTAGAQESSRHLLGGGGGRYDDDENAGAEGRGSLSARSRESKRRSAAGIESPMAYPEAEVAATADAILLGLSVSKNTAAAAASGGGGGGANALLSLPPSSQPISVPASITRNSSRTSLQRGRTDSNLSAGGGDTTGTRQKNPPPATTAQPSKRLSSVAAATASGGVGGASHTAATAPSESDATSVGQGLPHLPPPVTATSSGLAHALQTTSSAAASSTTSHHSPLPPHPGSLQSSAAATKQRRGLRFGGATKSRSSAQQTADSQGGGGGALSYGSSGGGAAGDVSSDGDSDFDFDTLARNVLESANSVFGFGGRSKGGKKGGLGGSNSQGGVGSANINGPHTSATAASGGQDIMAHSTKGDSSSSAIGGSSGQGGGSSTVVGGGSRSNPQSGGGPPPPSRAAAAATARSIGMTPIRGMPVHIYHIGSLSEQLGAASAARNAPLPSRGAEANSLGTPSQTAHLLPSTPAESYEEQHQVVVGSYADAAVGATSTAMASSSVGDISGTSEEGGRDGGGGDFAFDVLSTSVMGFEGVFTSANESDGEGQRLGGSSAQRRGGGGGGRPPLSPATPSSYTGRGGVGGGGAHSSSPTTTPTAAVRAGGGAQVELTPPVSGSSGAMLSSSVGGGAYSYYVDDSSLSPTGM